MHNLGTVIQIRKDDVKVKAMSPASNEVQGCPPSFLVLVPT